MLVLRGIFENGQISAAGGAYGRAAGCADIDFLLRLDDQSAPASCGSMRRPIRSAGMAILRISERRKGGITKAVRSPWIVKEVIVQRAFELAHRIGLSITERRALTPAPQAPPVGDDHDQPSAIGKDPPDLAHQAVGVWAALKRMGHQNRIETAISKRQFVLTAKGCRIGFRFWPAHSTPCVAGIMTTRRSASSKAVKNGPGKPRPSTARPLRSGQSCRSSTWIRRLAYSPCRL